MAKKLNGTNAAVKPLVLVVDDSKEVVDVVESWLEQSGLRVVAATDPFDGVRKAAMLAPDAILMDINMPGMDGLEATRYLKRMPITREIPVLAFTSEPPLEDDRLRARGFEKFVSKTLDADELCAEVRDAIEHRRAA
jgi:CheY-like chemotaxis protein